MREFDRPRAERFAVLWVNCVYAVGTVAWLVLALATRGGGWPLVAWFAMWGLTWLINVRGIAHSCWGLANLHTYGGLFSGKVLRTHWLLSMGIPVADVQLDPGDGSKPIRLSCIGLPSQVRPLRRGEEVQVLYCPGLGGAFGRSPRACLPLWRSEAPLQTADEESGDAANAEASADDAIKRDLAVCLAPLADYYTRRSVGCVVFAVSLPAVSLVVVLPFPLVGLALVIVGFTVALLAAWLSSKRATAAALSRFQSRFGEEGEERCQALDLLSEVGKVSPNYKDLAGALGERETSRDAC